MEHFLVVSEHRSGSRMPGPSFGGTSCVRKTRVWTRLRTAPLCLEEPLLDRLQRFPTPQWARQAPPPHWQTLPTPPCPLSPLYWPLCLAAWTSTSAGALHRPPLPASSDAYSARPSVTITLLFSRTLQTLPTLPVLVTEEPISLVSLFFSEQGCGRTTTSRPCLKIMLVNQYYEHGPSTDTNHWYCL